LVALTAGAAVAGGLGLQGTAIAADQGLQSGSAINASAQGDTDPWNNPDGEIVNTTWPGTPPIADAPCGLSYAVPPPTGVTSYCSAVLPTEPGHLLILGKRTTSTWLFVSAQR